MFSKEALAKLRSPERLDTMLVIAKPTDWLILVGICVLLISVVFWAFMGVFTVKAEGIGLITEYGGVNVVSHHSPGRIIDVYVDSGSTVHVGDVIANITDEGAVSGLIMGKDSLYLSKGKDELRERRDNYDSRRLEAYTRSNVICAFNGRVNEVMVKRGDLISPGMPICTVSSYKGRDDLMGVLYIDYTKAKRVKPGMTVQVKPNSVDSDESGDLLGIVKSVSDFPASVESIRRRLGNDELVRAVTKNGICVEVVYTLIDNKEDESGKLWTSVTGVHRPVTPGTVCTGSIIVERKAPIDKVFYNLTQWLRIKY